jgi:branched-chain amino acid transport system substrate-binding protein
VNRADFLGTAGAFSGATIINNTQNPLLQPINTPTLRIAAVCPQSGEDRAIGNELVRGIRAAIDYLNDQRASFNPFLICDYYDDRNAAANATVQASFAVGNPQTQAVIGHLSAAATMVALPVYANAQIALIVPTVTDDRLTAQGYQNIFRLPTKDAIEGGLLASYAIFTGSQAPHVVTQSGDYGPAVAAGFVRKAGAQHVNASVTTLAADAPDYSAAATAIIAHVPDSVTFAGNVDDLGPLLGTLRHAGYTGRFLASQGFFDAQTVQSYAKDADGMTVSSCVPYYPLAPTTTRNVQDFQQHDGALTPVAAFGYAAVQLIQAAQLRVNAANRLTLIRAITSNGPWDTITGSYTFLPGGDAYNANCYFYVVKDGKFDYVRQALRSGFMLK